jgi:hypothetical protein
MKPIILLIVLFVSIVILNAYTIHETFETIKEIKRTKAIEETQSQIGDEFYKTGKIMGSNEVEKPKLLNDYDVEYHDTPEQIAIASGINLDTNITWVFDPIKKKKIAIRTPAVQQSYIYYELGSPGYEYGGATYVPNYEESVLLSKTNRFFT